MGSMTACVHGGTISITSEGCCAGDPEPYVKIMRCASASSCTIMSTTPTLDSVTSFQYSPAHCATFDVYTSTFTPMKISLAGRVEKAFMKLIVDTATDKVVGAHMVGPDSAEIMQGIGIALKCGATKAQFDSTVGIHPSSAEEFVTMRTLTRTVGPKVEAAVGAKA